MFNKKIGKKQESTSMKIDNASHCDPSEFKYLVFGHGYSEMKVKLKGLNT